MKAIPGPSLHNLSCACFKCLPEQDKKFLTWVSKHTVFEQSYMFRAPNRLEYDFLLFFHAVWHKSLQWETYSTYLVLNPSSMSKWLKSE